MLLVGRDTLVDEALLVFGQRDDLLRVTDALPENLNENHPLGEIEAKKLFKVGASHALSVPKPQTVWLGQVADLGSHA